jgi:hypothetical protein
MSGLGHLRRFGTPRAASGLPHSTDIARPGPLVRFVPKHKVAALQPAAREQEPERPVAS